MAKALGLVVAVVVLEGLVLFGAIVPGQLQETLALALLGRSVLGQALGNRVRQEVQVEAGSLGLVLADQAHAQRLLVKLERLFNVLDAKHGVVLLHSVSNFCGMQEKDNPCIWTHHAVGADIRLSLVLRLLDGLLADNLNPVAVRVERKGNVPHAAVGELLLELVPGVLDALARGLDVVDADAGVAEAAVRLRVAVVGLEVGVILGAVVVRQLDDALAVDKRVSVRDGLRAVVRHKVEVKLGLGHLELLDEAHAEELVEFDCIATLGLAVVHAYQTQGGHSPDSLGSLTRILSGTS